MEKIDNLVPRASLRKGEERPNPTSPPHPAISWGNALGTRLKNWHWEVGLKSPPASFRTLYSHRGILFLRKKAHRYWTFFMKGVVDGVLVFCTVWRRTQLLWPLVELPCSSQLTQAFWPPNWVYSSKARDTKSGINLIQVTQIVWLFQWFSVLAGFLVTASQIKLRWPRNKNLYEKQHGLKGFCSHFLLSKLVFNRSFYTEKLHSYGTIKKDVAIQTNVMYNVLTL